MDFPQGITADMAPDEALTFLRRFLDGRPDDDTLCAAALTIGEPLIDWHWAVIEEYFVALMREQPDLRKIVSCCDFDGSVPEAVRERLYSFVRPEDDIGRQPAERKGDPEPRGLVTIASELANRLQVAPEEEVSRIVRSACEIAVRSSGLTSQDADAALTLLAGRGDQSARKDLVERLNVEQHRLDEGSLQSVGGAPEQAHWARSFRLARAYEALRFALDPSVPRFADRAVFAAAFATSDRAEFISMLLSEQDR